MDVKPLYPNGEYDAHRRLSFMKSGFRSLALVMILFLVPSVMFMLPVAFLLFAEGLGVIEELV